MTPDSNCVDARVENGKKVSEDACRKAYMIADELKLNGFPVDQADQGFTCSKTAMLSPIGLMNAVIEGMQLHVDDNGLEANDPQNVGRESMRAMQICV